MSLVINHNLMAMNAARNLSKSYGDLSVSTRRLSSGLRISTAADDAAGLAIRELMRSDIASLNQGVRNANDAISMIQVADGALQVIDEKLVRMKELATQASTGTYTSDQRLIIDSEYQAMASEIQRIAMATDFNGIKLLDGSLSSRILDASGLTPSGKLKIHFGTGNDSAEDYYYIQVQESGSHALSLGSGSTFSESMNKLASKFQESFQYQFIDMYKSGELTSTEYNFLLDLGQTISNNIKGFGDPQTVIQFEASYGNIYGDPITDPLNPLPPTTTYNHETYSKPEIPGDTWDEKFAFYTSMPTDDKQKVMYLFGRESASIHNEDYLRWVELPSMNPWYPPDNGTDLPDNVTPEMVQKAISDASSWYLNRHDYAGMNIATQENAQISLDAINKAIVEKDKVRANLGAMQNRLENTITNLQIQSENLLAAESRISDVDTAQEMTNFVRNQILTQAAVAMLAQANSLPQMAMQLMQG